MKYAFFLIAFAALQTSCKKCATCTYTDSVTKKETVHEICDSGHVFENEKTTYENTGWICE